MSLFPAYSELCASLPINSETIPKDTNAEWLENNSFTVAKFQGQHAQDEGTKVIEIDDTDISNDSQHFSSSSFKKKKKKHRKKSKKHKEKEASPSPVPAKIVEFDGNEEFYVDKSSAPQYKTVHTLHKPACPRYRLHYRRMGSYSLWLMSAGGQKSVKRYYDFNKIQRLRVENAAALDENEYTLQLSQLNRKLMENPEELSNWLDVIQLHELNPYKWSRLLLAEKKIDTVQRALVHHPQNEALYRVYIDTVNATYPSFEVSKMLDQLLTKDPCNYTLWTALIMATQSSMARCVVPEVLHIYERCMGKMHHADKQVADITGRADEVNLKLFNNCALFLRQAGLYEQFFALIKLALELNVSTEHFGDFATRESDENTLIEYEELVLQSGLPMNEIWLRVEKLRQGFNFLPSPIDTKCSDPQRVVFNEDICHYVYPLNSREKSFYLVLLILRLLKLPFVQCHGLAGKLCNRVEQMGDSDAIEDVLAVCLRRNFALPQVEHDKFVDSLYVLVKEMAVSPTFLSSHIGHELYAQCIAQFLLSSANVYANIDERRRIIFHLLWCRFERLLLLYQKYGKKLDEAYVKAGRSRFKSLLKQKPNRNVLNLYTEFALYEYEALNPAESLESVQNIFVNVINANYRDETLCSDLCHIYAVYAEILISRKLHEDAIQLLVSYAFSSDIVPKEPVSTARKLSALHKINEKLENLITIETNVEIMVLEQYLLPDYTVSLIKLAMYLQYLLGNKLEALKYLDKLLCTFHKDSERHSFLREHIQELNITLMELPSADCAISNIAHSTKIFTALAEFPQNLFILQRCAMLTWVAWYKVRSSILCSSPNILAITLLITSSHYRFLQTNCAAITSPSISDLVIESDGKYSELIVRNRVLNMFRTAIAQADGDQLREYQTLQRNALFWRFYLRCLSDQNTAFETSKKCLLTALDECPWNKALYLDGATYVPQELTHLQDLILEKQLRIYALPEELEILRTQ